MIRHSLFFCMMAITALCMAQSPDISSVRANYNLVPIVNYTPSYFNRAIDNAFKFDGSKQCFFVSKKSDKSILWYNDFSQTGEYALTDISSNAPELSSILDKASLLSDSIFVFNPFPAYSHEFIPQHVQYIGIKDNGIVKLISGDIVYDNLGSFMTAQFGSIQNFSDKYLECVTEALYYPYNGLYSFNDDEAAIDFLRNDYLFNAINGKDFKSVFDRFMQLLRTGITISPEEETILEKALSGHYLTGDRDTATLSSDFLAGRELQLFDTDMLRKALTKDELLVAKSIIKENGSRLRSAYRHLSSKYPNIAPDNHYYTDLDILESISSRIFKLQ